MHHARMNSLTIHVGFETVGVVGCMMLIGW